MSRSRSFAAAVSICTVILLVATAAYAGGVRFQDSEETPEKATAIAVSPNGAHVYVTGRGAQFGQDSISVHETDGTGNLTKIQTFLDSNLEDATAVAVSGDGKHVYVTARGATGGDGRLTVFTRANNGTLTFLEVVFEDGLNGIPANTMKAPQGVIVSGKGSDDLIDSDDYSHVYIVTRGSDSILVFKRDNNTASVDFGKLTYVQSLQATAMSCNMGGLCGLNDARTMAISPDGTSLYVGGRRDSSKTGHVVVFDRNNDHLDLANFGKLAFVEKIRNLEGGITGLHRPSALVVSPDGEHLYATSQGGDTVHVFAREDDTGSANHGKLTYIEFHKDGGVTKGLKEATGLAIDPNGDYVYVTAGGDFAISVFSRDSATGRLSIVETQFHQPDTTKPAFLELIAPQDIVISTDGLHLYVAAILGDVISFDVDICGDGERGSDEQCDGGGDCSPACRLTLCATPATNCTTTLNAAPETASLTVKNDPLSADTKDQVKWKWSAGTIALGAFGDPRDTNSYILCVYDDLDQPILQLAAPHGTNDDCKTGDHCWKSSPGPSTSNPHIATGNVKQFKYQDKSYTPNGLQQLQLKTGVGNASLKLSGKGAHLAVPSLAGLNVPIKAIMKDTDTDTCYSSTFTTFTTNDGVSFKAKNSN